MYDVQSLTILLSFLNLLTCPLQLEASRPLEVQMSLTDAASAENYLYQNLECWTLSGVPQ